MTKAASKAPNPAFSKLSSQDYEKIHPVAYALREAGFVPIPRYWIKGTDMPKLKALTDTYRDEVNTIRTGVHIRLGLKTPDDYGPLPIGIASDTTDDPRFNKDTAWAAFERASK